MEPLLLSTDFDGTLAGPFEQEPSLAPAFFEWLGEMKKRRPVIWTINTGRDWQSLGSELGLRNPPFWPDWVVLIEREIYQVKEQRIFSFEDWNRACERAHDTLFHKAEALLEELHQRLEQTSGLQIISDPGSPFGLIAESEEQGDEVAQVLREVLPREPQLAAVRNSIYFRFSHADYNKGTCLDRIGRELGIAPSHRFAAGDHYNDVPMLRHRFAHHLACPGNAIDEVRQLVRQEGGYLSQGAISEGIAEALHHFFPLSGAFQE